MAFIPVTREQHSGKFLLPLSSFAHAAKSAAVEVVLGELAQVTACYPMFFIRQGEGYHLVALLGMKQGENLYVDRAGRWTGLYVPAMLRAYPFTMVPQNGQLSVFYDEASGLLSDKEGEPLFGTGEGEPNGPLARAIKLLTELNLDGERTAKLAKQLADYGLLKAATLKMDRSGQPGEALDGIFAVDEAALGGLGDEAFLGLRRSGALILAHAQMLSLGQLGRLQAEANIRDRDNARLS